MPHPLPRLKPAPLPDVTALPEYLAEGDLKADYEDTKAVLQVPWMGVVAMAFAGYRSFYRALWPALRPVFASAAMVEDCRRLRQQAEEAVLGLDPPPIAERLAAMGYAPRELRQIREMIEVFSHGNFPYTVMATLARLLLEEHELDGRSDAAAFDGRHAPGVTVPFLLMEPHHVDAPTRAVYDDIKHRLDLPFVNTDYRAFARWPSYFSEAWGDLRPHVQSEAYEAIVARLHDDFVEASLRLPNPEGLTSAALRRAAEADAPGGEVLSVVRLFQWLLPGLITNVAFFRQQFAGCADPPENSR
ncbi:MAG: halocarboxylic acid dehydrogenase DehI family protein [Methyloligellaceae bacterium]